MSLTPSFPTPAAQGALPLAQWVAPDALPAWQPPRSPTPADAPPAVHVPTPAGQETGATPPGSAWQAPADLLAEIEPEAQSFVQSALRQRWEIAQAERALPPEQRRLAPPSVLFQHLARPRLQPTDLCLEDHVGLHRLLRLGLWLAMDALEAGVLLGADAVYAPLLAEQCAELGRVYRELKRQAEGWVAPLILHGELRLLHHRGSAVVESLLFA